MFPIIIQNSSTEQSSIMIPKLRYKSTQQSQVPEPLETASSPESAVITQYVVSLTGQESEKIYIKHGFLGKGGFANCYVTQQVGSTRLTATKIIEKCRLKSSRTKLRLIHEIKIHKTFAHPNIVEFVHYFEDSHSVYIMLELCENESLNQLLKYRGTLTWPEVQSLLYGICKGVQYLHGRKYIHRDLKLANIFLNDKFQVKIGDFGLTSHLEFLKENKRTVCGTPNYLAPEVIEGTGYYFEVDIWAIGIILFALFYGHPPFECAHTPEIFSKITSCQYSIPKNANVPNEAIQLIKSILVPEPQKRPSVQEILNSSFMKLGKGVLMELPACCNQRPPSKSELERMPALGCNGLPTKQVHSKANNYVSCQKLARNQKSTAQSTIYRDDFSRAPSQIDDHKLSRNEFKLVRKTTGSARPPALRNQIYQTDYVVEFETFQQGCHYFRTQKGVVGTYERDKQICFADVKWFQNQIEQIRQIRLYNNLFSEEGEIPFQIYKFKAFLSVKVKSLLKSLKKQEMLNKKEALKSGLTPGKESRLVYVTRVNVHKDAIMLKLSNKNIQVLYEPMHDGFLYAIPRNQLFHYQSVSRPVFKQLSISSMEETVNNFVKMSQNKSKLNNIQTTVAVAESAQALKLPILKLKQMCSILAEVRTAAQKHSRNRNSQ